MNIAGFDVQPILLHIPDEEKYAERYKESLAHYEQVGLKDIISVSGIYGQGFGIVGTHPYELDNPNGGHMIGVKYTASFLSQYMIYNVMKVLPNEYFMFLECDTRMPDDFMRKLQFEMFNLPSDFDFLFIGSCCASDKPKKNIGGNVYEFPKKIGYPCQYPLGGNCYIISKKCLDHVIATQRDAYAPADLSLGMHSFYNMDVYAILPRLVEQKGNENLPA